MCQLYLIYKDIYIVRRYVRLKNKGNPANDLLRKSSGLLQLQNSIDALLQRNHTRHIPQSILLAKGRRE